MCFGDYLATNNAFFRVKNEKNPLWWERVALVFLAKSFWNSYDVKMIISLSYGLKYLHPLHTQNLGEDYLKSHSPPSLYRVCFTCKCNGLFHWLLEWLSVIHRITRKMWITPLIVIVIQIRLAMSFFWLYVLNCWQDGI